VNYYKFHIGDYQSHTAHLDPLEDIAYRRMMDWCYLHERDLPLDIEKIAKAIRMRSHCDCIEYVLSEFFQLSENGYINKRITSEVEQYQSKSQKARESAEARWKGNADANALRPECEGNANHKPLTINHKPLTIPSEINPEAWGEFEQHRKEMKQPLTELARKKAMTAISGFSFEEQAEIIDNTIQNRWRGLFPGKAKEKNNYDWRKNT